VLLNVFNVVGVVVVFVVMPGCRLTVPWKVGTRSDVFSDNFGFFVGDKGSRRWIFCGGSIDNEVIGSC
jgi:hypothetical protein